MFGKRKRTNRSLQLIILNALRNGDKTVYEIAKTASLHFNVVKHQLVILRGQGFAEVAFEHGKFKLFRITRDGERCLRKW